MTTQSKPSALFRILKKISRKLYFKRTLILFAHELADGHRNIKSSTRFDAHLFTAADLPACQTHFAFMVDAYKEFLQKGYLGVAAVSTTDGNVGATVWFTPTSFTDNFYGCTVTLNEDEVFQMAGEVAEPYRNSPLAANLMFAGWDYWQEKGKKRILTLIQDDNAPSMKFSISAGFRESGKAYVIHRILGLRFFQTLAYQGERFAHHKKENRKLPTRDKARA